MRPLIYLNWASDLSPEPPNPGLRAEVARYTAIQDRWSSDPEASWSAFWGATRRARGALGALLGAEPRQLLFTTGTLHGLEILAGSYGAGPGELSLVSPGMKVLTTDVEYGDVYRALDGRFDVEIARVHGAASEGEVVSRLVAAARRARPRMVVLSHVSLLDGMVLPVAAIVRALRAELGEGALVVVDGAQAAGNVDVDLGALGADVYLGCFHKWLQGPNLTGFAYFRRVEHLHALAERPIHVLSFDDGLLREVSPALATECSRTGLHAPHAAALAGHLEHLSRDGLDTRGRRHAEGLRGRLLDAGLAARILGPADPGMRSGIVSLRVARSPAEDAAVERVRRGAPGDPVLAVTHYRPRIPRRLAAEVEQPAVVRLSCVDRWNTDAEIDVAAARVGGALRACG